jgi:hypothetical protein
MTSGTILQIVALAVVLLASVQWAKRKREVDSAGNPTLRMWSNCFLGLMAGIFWLWVMVKNLSDPFHQRYPENTAVEAFFCVFSFLIGAWGYCYKITLTNTAITRRYLPWLTRVCPIEGVESVESTNAGSAIIRLRDGRKIGVMPLLSGRPFFLQNLGKLLSGRRPIVGSGD